MEDLIRRRGFAASDLSLHYLPMTHNKDARPIWVKYYDELNTVTKNKRPAARRDP